jgi:prepilin-type N-terminal cleavage/methylation domain-containing protein
VLPGFSLVELMIALGILGIGFAMAAALFPAALKQTELSYNDTIGTIIAQNGLAVARAILTGSAVGVDPNVHVIAQDGAIGPPIDPNLRAYHDDPNAVTPDKGFLVLGSQPVGSDTKLLVIVAYAKKNPGASVRAEEVQLVGTIGIDYTGTIQGPYIDKVKVHSPLILKSGAGYATITDVNATNGKVTLDHNQLAGLGGNAWVIVEQGQGVSPAIAVLVARVALPQ